MIKYAYVGALVAIFLFSMGNRPVCDILPFLLDASEADMHSRALQQGFVYIFVSLIATRELNQAK
jgi:hypothetical protein